MISLRTEVKTELRYNVCDDAITEEKCCIQCKVKEYSLIAALSSVLFWMIDFLQINYILKMMFCNVNDAVMIIEWAFSIKFVNNDSSTAWESENRMQKDNILLLKRLNKYDYIYIQWQNLCCCLFYATILFRVCTSSLLCECFVNRFILRHLCFLYIVFFFILFCFCISFQQSKYVNNVTYNIHCILNWLSFYRLDL